MRGDRSCLNHYTRLMKLAGEERKRILNIIHQGIDYRPKLLKRAAR